MFDNIISDKMNMRTPKNLVDKDPLMSGVQLLEGALSLEVTENDWTDEEIEDFEIEVRLLHHWIFVYQFQIQ